MDYAALGKRVRICRINMKLSQERLAEYADVSISFIGHIERGTRIPSVETVYKLCKVLGVSADFLMGIEQ